MSELAIESISFCVTESAPAVRLVEVREVTKKRKLSAAEKRTLDECDRIVADPATKWHDWRDVRKQLGL